MRERAGARAASGAGPCRRTAVGRHSTSQRNLQFRTEASPSSEREDSERGLSEPELRKREPRKTAFFAAFRYSVGRRTTAGAVPIPFPPFKASPACFFRAIAVRALARRAARAPPPCRTRIVPPEGGRGRVCVCGGDCRPPMTVYYYYCKLAN